MSDGGSELMTKQPNESTSSHDLVENGIGRGGLVSQTPDLESLAVRDPKDVGELPTDGSAVRVVEGGIAEGDDVLVVSHDVDEADVRGPSLSLPLPGEEVENLLLALVVASHNALAAYVPDDVIGKMFLHPIHVAFVKCLESLSHDRYVWMLLLAHLLASRIGVPSPFECVLGGYPPQGGSPGLISSPVQTVVLVNP